MTNEIVRVPLGGERAYEIHIADGVIDQAGALLSPLLRRKRLVVVTDENVAAAQGGDARPRPAHPRSALA